MTRPVPTFDHLVSRKKPITKTVPIALDPELAEAHYEARRAQEMAAARAGARPDDTESQALLWEAEEGLARLEARLAEEDAVAVFTFRSIGRATYDALVDSHQPNASQRAKAKSLGMGEIAWDPDTFPPAIVAASLVEPKLTEAEALALWQSDDWNQAELGALLQAAIEVNGTRRTLELGKDWRKTPTSAPKSDGASSTASPTPSS